jgi:hypothetical protein
LVVDPSKLTPEEIENVAKLQHYAAIGHVAAEWSYFELVIDSWSLSASGIHVQPGVCLTSQIAGHARKLDAFISITRLLNPNHGFGAELDQFCKDANSLAEQRNRTIHDHWDTDDILNPRRIEATARKKLRLKHVDVPTEELLKLALNIDALRDRFDDLASRIISAPRPSHEKPPPKPAP